jgi:hypothetical protein
MASARFTQTAVVDALTSWNSGAVAAVPACAANAVFGGT